MDIASVFGILKAIVDKPMKTKTRFLLIAILTLASGVANAAPITLLSQQSTWDYNTTASNINHTIFGTYDFSDFTANYTGASTGQAGFGNTTPPSGGATNTLWVANTDLALQTTINIGGSVVGDVTLNLATDNGALVFVNGVEVFREIAEGYTSIWEYSQTVSGGLFNAGINTISVLTEDHGGATFFDMELVANDGITTRVPEPGVIALFALGLAGLGFGRRRAGQ